MTFTRMENQKAHPLPSICISPPGILNRKVLMHNITYAKLGKWKSSLEGYDEEITYDDISASFEGLVTIFIE